MTEVPLVAAFAGTHVLIFLALRILFQRAPFAGEIGAGAFGAPLIGMVIDRFPQMRVVIHHSGAAVAEDIGGEGTDHLRVAQIAAFRDIDITAGEFERGVEFLEAALNVFLAIDYKGGNNLYRPTNGCRHKHQHRKW